MRRLLSEKNLSLSVNNTGNKCIFLIFILSRSFFFLYFFLRRFVSLRMCVWAPLVRAPLGRLAPRSTSDSLRARSLSSGSFRVLPENSRNYLRRYRKAAYRIREINISIWRAFISLPSLPLPVVWRPQKEDAYHPASCFGGFKSSGTLAGFAYNKLVVDEFSRLIVIAFWP